MYLIIKITKMKKITLVLTIICAVWLAGCKKEKDRDKEITLMEDAIFQNENPDLKITLMNEFLEPEMSSTKKMDAKSSDDGSLKANDYGFKQVADVSTLNVRDANGVVRTVQATSVKISDDGYAFVSYNHQGPPNVGGLVVFKYTVHDGTLQKVWVDVEVVTSIRMPNAQVNAIDYDKKTNTLYLAGASEEPKFGYEGDANIAFFLVMELDANKKFKIQEPLFYTHLTSFQATSIRKNNNRIYITTGDGTVGPKGGLYIYDASNYAQVKFFDAQHARSVDVDKDGNIYLLQANSERVTKFDANGNVVKRYPANNDVQKDAKSEILVWNNYLFVAEKDYGLRMLDKDNGDVNVEIERPGPNKDLDVTNSVSMNSDKKKDVNGKEVQSNLLLLANGEMGVYWYDVMKDANGIDRIVKADKNRILGGNSANYIESKGNIVFVAEGLGGLKILYIGEEETTWNCSDAFRYHTFIKDNGNDKGDPYTRKVGDVFFTAEGDNLVVYLFSVNNLPDDFDFTDDDGTVHPNIKTINLKNAGVAFGSSLEDFDKAGLLSGGGGSLKDKNVNNGAM